MYPGDLNVTITNDKKQPIPIEVEDNGDGTYAVGYTPSAVGPLSVSVHYAGKLIPQCPVTVPVQSHVDVSKIKVDGLEPSKSCFFIFQNLSCFLRTMYRGKELWGLVCVGFSCSDG